MSASSSNRDRLKRRDDSDARNVIDFDDDDDNDDDRDNNRAASTTLLGPTPLSDPRDSRDGDAVAEVSKRRRKITVRHVKDLYEESVDEFDLSQFERQSVAALDVLIRTLTWDEYVRLASFSSVGYQRFLGLDPGALGIYTGENRDQHDILPDNLVYYEGVKEFLRRDYGISYVESDCTAEKAFERRMVSQALAEYAPPPRADNDVSKLETLIKLRRLYIWLVALGRNPSRSTEMIQYVTNNRLMLAAYLGGGAVTIFLSDYLYADDGCGIKEEAVSFMWATIIDVFRVATAANQTDANRLIQALIQKSLLLRDYMSRIFVHYGSTSRKIITGIYNHEGVRWNTDPKPQNTLFLSHGMTSVFEIGNVLFMLEKQLEGDGWNIVRFDQGTAQLPLTEWQIRQPEHMSRIGVIDYDFFRSVPVFAGPSFVVGMIDDPAELYRDIYLMNLDPRGLSHLVHFRDYITDAYDDGNVFTFPLLDEYDRVYWRVLGYQQNMKYITAADSSGQIAKRAYATIRFVVLDLDTTSDAVRNIRSYVWIAPYHIGGGLFAPFALHQNRFLINSELPSVASEYTVFDSDTGTIAFYGQRDGDIGQCESKPMVAYELENAPPLPNNWRRFFAHEEFGADEQPVAIGDNRVQLPPSDAIMLIDVRATVSSTTVANNKTVPLYSELNISRNEALIAILNSDSDAEDSDNILL